MWKCAGCGEKHANTFESCWNCGAAKDGSTPDDLRSFETAKAGVLGETASDGTGAPTSALETSEDALRRSDAWVEPDPAPLYRFQYERLNVEAANTSIHSDTTARTPLDSQIQKIIGKLRDGDPAFRQDAFQELVDIGPPAAESLFNLALEEIDLSVRPYLSEALGRIGTPRALELLDHALDDGDLSVRWFAVDGLAAAGPAGSKPLIRALDDRDESVRQSVARSLGMARDPDAVDPLIRALRDRDLSVRQTAAQSLGMIGDIRAVDPLVDLLADANPELSPYIVQSLGMLGASAVTSLLHRIKERGSPIHYAAIRTIGLLSSWPDTVRTVLSDTTLTPRDRFEILVQLDADVPVSCHAYIDDPHQSVARGAREVIDYSTLARSSRSADDPSVETLLRPAGVGAAGPSENLLRPIKSCDALENRELVESESPTTRGKRAPDRTSSRRTRAPRAGK